MRRECLSETSTGAAPRAGGRARPGRAAALGRGALAALGLCALSCGGAGAASPAPAGRWKDLKTKDQEVAFMKAVVAPRMEKVFRGHDEKRHDDFGCKTCHGPASADPKAFLPKLAMKDGKLAAFSEKPEISKFMAEKVVPEMAAAMGEPPYDPATHQGFGCGGCHAIEAN
ncbi:MAG TPA: hypothetical protein VFS43_12450 [Polyangiaceae bacterium]|nr:hypothetical protein [Polyangiaceae bacterium]